jgi:hypothetical protein
MHAVAVSYLEWIRWIATGWFRCADRVVWLDGAEDQQGVDALMDRTPDLQVSDDQGYVIACLKSDALFSGRHSGRERSAGHLSLSMEAVSSFHPLSIRGARLLEADAERAAVRLGEPIFEKTWGNWRDRLIEDEAHWRGRSLCAALGLKPPDLNTTPNQVSDILAGRKPTPNAAKVRDGAFEGTRALGWVSAMPVALISPSVDGGFKKTLEYENIRSVIKSLRDDLRLQRPLLDDPVVLQTAKRIDSVLRDLGAEVLPLALMATVLHYRSLALGGREVSLGALLDDLTTLALDDSLGASLSAYFIGRGMENVAVTTLLYQSDPGRYPALAPATGRRLLDVMALAAVRLESKQPVKAEQQQNPPTPSKFDGANAGAPVNTTNTLSQAGCVPESRSQPDRDPQTGANGAASSSSNSPSLNDQPKSEPSNLDAIIGSETRTEELTSGPLAPGSEEAGETQNFESEIKVDLSLKATDDLELVTSSGKLKGNRKNSDKTSKITSAAETPDDKPGT